MCVAPAGAAGAGTLAHLQGMVLGEEEAIHLAEDGVASCQGDGLNPKP